jgi:16S rRNA processing protein RimM
VAGAEKALLFGVLGKPHGLRGDIFLRAFNVRSARAMSPKVPVEVVLSGPSGEVSKVLEFARHAGKGPDLLVHFSGVDSRELAASLTGSELRISRVSLPPLAPGEFYIEDLVGCTVVDLDGKSRGVVQRTIWNGAQDIIAVVGEGGEWLVPVVPDFVREVDVGAARIVVDPHE